MPRGRTKLDRSAEAIGRALGHVAARVSTWKKQRDQIAAEIRQVVRTGESLLSDLGHTATRRGRRAVAKVKRTARRGRPVGYKVSAATRAKLRAAWKRRKALVKK
jgi:ElaB/YqjD/DUF883 family membrane-anchored ribosome-binding protein